MIEISQSDMQEACPHSVHDWKISVDKDTVFLTWFYEKPNNSDQMCYQHAISMREISFSADSKLMMRNIFTTCHRYME